MDRPVPLQNYRMSNKQLPIISLFSGALGLDLGLERAGFKVAAAVECNPFAAETIRKNRPDIALVERRIEEVTTAELLKLAKLKKNEPVVITGGPNCQSFSTAGLRGSLSDPRGVLFREFVRVVKEARPRFFVMENVRGVLSAAVKHRSLAKRGPGHPSLSKKEELGSAFALITRELKKLNYSIVFDVLNAADFGVPQARERLIFIGSRDGEQLVFPKPSHAKNPTDGQDPWVTLRQAFEKLEDDEEEHTALSPKKKKYLRQISAGKNWRSLPKNLHAEALGKAHVSWGGRSGFYRRLAWDRPSPALTTKPDSKATMMCHPTKLRPLSVKECARLQQYPDDWQFAGGIPQKYKQVGNAVPLGLGKVVGTAIKQAIKSGKRDKSLLGKISCPNTVLITRLSNRPLTILNPKRMRKVKSDKATKTWLKAQSPKRKKFLKSLSLSVAASAASRNGHAKRRPLKGKPSRMAIR